MYSVSRLTTCKFTARNSLSSAFLCYLLSDPCQLKFITSSPGRGIVELWAEHCLGVCQAFARVQASPGYRNLCHRHQPLGARGFALMNAAALITTLCGGPEAQRSQVSRQRSLGRIWCDPLRGPTRVCRDVVSPFPFWRIIILLM